MAAVRHLGFVMRVFGPPTKEYLVVFITVLKFGWNRCNGFGNVQVLIFCKFDLKMISNAPKIGSLEGCDPINV